MAGFFEAYINSRLNQAGGTVMSGSDRAAGFVYQSGPYKGLTPQQAYERAAEEWRAMSPQDQEAWGRQYEGIRTPSELASANPTAAPGLPKPVVQTGRNAIKAISNIPFMGAAAAQTAAAVGNAANAQAQTSPSSSPPPAQPQRSPQWQPSGSLSPNYGQWFTGLGNRPAPTPNVGLPPPIVGDASLLPDNTGTSRSGDWTKPGSSSTFISGPGAGGRVVTQKDGSRVAYDASGREVGRATFAEAPDAAKTAAAPAAAAAAPATPQAAAPSPAPAATAPQPAPSTSVAPSLSRAISPPPGLSRPTSIISGQQLQKSAQAANRRV